MLNAILVHSALVMCVCFINTKDEFDRNLCMCCAVLCTVCTHTVCPRRRYLFTWIPWPIQWMKQMKERATKKQTLFSRKILISNIRIVYSTFVFACSLFIYHYSKWIKNIHASGNWTAEKNREIEKWNEWMGTMEAEMERRANRNVHTYWPHSYGQRSEWV